MNYGEKIINLRNKKGWTQYRLHKEAGINQPTLSRIEKELVTPSTDILSKICIALGVSMAEFDDNTPIDKVILHAEKMNLSEEQKMALEIYKKKPPEEQQKKLDNAIEKLKNLSPADREALIALINSLATQK